MTDFTEQFLVEARELAEQASADLLKLEEQPGDGQVLERAFRAFHTLKGAAGIMEYAAMEHLLHRAEDVLQDVRAGGRTVSPVLVDALLACVGQLVRWFDVIERTGEMPAGAAADAERLGAAFGSSNAPSVAAAPAWQEELLAWARVEKGGAGASARSAIRYQPAADCFFRGIDPLAQIAAVPGIIALRLSPAAPWPALADLQPFDCNLIIEALSTAPKADIEAVLRPDGELSIIQLASEASASLSAPARAILEEQLRYLRLETSPDMDAGRTGAAARATTNVLRALGRSTAAVAAASGASKALAAAIEAELSGAPPQEGVTAPRETATTIRVEIEKVDRIVDLTGELMVAKNALGHLARLAVEGGDAKILAMGLKTQHELLDRHIADLQRSVFDLRVLPLERVFGRFPRLVRETASALGKQVSFSTEGEDTKADKAVVEALFEPLLHIIRNAIDHGIEPPAQRTAAGKPAAASILLSARREGDRVIVEVSDDGAGIDPAVIRRIATSRHVAEEAAIAAMSDDDAVALIFAPGFSTAEKVTGLSGRGVGMGAVRSAIEQLGGEVRLLNRPGQGLTVRLILPFTIMLTRVMTVHAGGQVFGVPFDAIVETVRVPRDAIRPLGAGRAFVLRNETIPVVDLAHSLGLPPAAATGQASILVVWAGGIRAGLEIDRPGERMDMILKPVEGLLSGMPAVAGASLLGTGEVLIVLDLEALLQ